MLVLYAGCNLFGQITDSTELAFESFHAHEATHLEDLAVGHSVIVMVRTDGDVVMHGHGLQPRQTHTITKLNIPKGAGKIKTVVSDTRVFFLDGEGELHVLDFLEKDVAVTRKPNFLVREQEGEDKIVDIACGVAIKVALSANGRVYNIPNQLGFVNSGIVQICAGNEHCLLLDDSGNVYSFGRGSRGQLGHCTLENEDEPKLLDALSGIKITKISCGSWHSAALSAEGDVYVWGWNSDGQLGLFHEDDGRLTADSTPEPTKNDEEQEEEQNTTIAEEKKPASVIAVPSLVQFDGEEKIVGVACGSRHTVFVNDKKILFGCGCNKFNQLGLKQREAIYTVSKLHEIGEKLNIWDIVCGPAATAVLLN